MNPLRSTGTEVLVSVNWLKVVMEWLYEVGDSLGCPNDPWSDISGRGIERDRESEKKLSSPSARLKGVSKYNNSKTQSPEVPQVAIEVGISVALAVVLVLLFKLVIKKVTKR